MQGAGGNSGMGWPPTSAVYAAAQPPAAPAAPPAAPNTDSLLSRFGICAGDEVLGSFLIGDSGNYVQWYTGVSARQHCIQIPGHVPAAACMLANSKHC